MTHTAAIKRPRRAAKKVNQSSARIEVEILLEEYSELQKKAEELKAQMDEVFGSIDKTMNKSKLMEVDSVGWNASIVDVKTNTKNVTDAHKLYKILEKNGDEEDFWGAVNVSAVKVKKVVTGKEYASITETTPGKVTGTKLKVTPTKKTVTSK